jgi:hypothetical protein
MKKYLSIYLTLAMALAISLLSCNKDDNSTDTSTSSYDVYSTASTLVSTFNLKANTKIMNNLDSVKFTIDQDRGIIYNADSLPRGTRINALLVEMTCASTVASKEFIIKNGTVLRDTTINYTTSSTDSIDFTGDVTLRITSGNKLNVRDYKVLVNVHKQDVDTIVWNASRRRDLPNVSSTLNASKTVMQGVNFLCLVDDNGSFVLSQSEDPAAGTWSKTVLSLPFTPQIASFTATTDALYMLDTNGQLFKSTDMGANWTDCGVAWTTIIGAYGDILLGIVPDGIGGFLGAEIVDGTAYIRALKDGFPISGMSQLVMANNEWTSSQQAMFVGGVLADGTMTNKVWGFDGKHWAPISNDNVLPAMRDAVLFPYYTMVKRSTGATYDKKVTWMIMGGKLSNGKLNTTSYISRNQGINWSVGESCVQQPAHMPAFYGAQVYPFSRTITGSTLMAYTPGHVTPVTEWDCRYLYLFGGYGSNGTALNSVWEGVLTGLTFKPVF